MSREFTSNLASNTDFSITYVDGYEEIDDLLVNQHIDAAVVIPAGFGDAVRELGASAPVQVVLDGVDTLAANQVTGSLLGYASSFGVKLSKQFAIPSPPLQVYSQHAYSTGADRRNSMIPGLIPLVFSLPAMAAALALTRERETKTLESLVVTPVRPLEYLVGKLIAYVSTALVGLLPVWLVATVAFGVPFRGDPALFVVTTAVFLLANMGMAIFIGNLVRSQQTATVIALFVFFVPGFFLAGLIDPIDTTNAMSAGMSYALPATHFVTICRAIFIKGAAFGEIWTSVVGLLGIAVIWTGLGALTFRKRVS
jgi:ABC-type multidrug transport system permease subunit